MIKVQVNEKKQVKEIEYPCLMVSSTGAIVLFTEYKEGVLLRQGESFWKEGHFASDWIMDSFTPFEGCITLSNGGSDDKK